jgi:hypothetical protein
MANQPAFRNQKPLDKLDRRIHANAPMKTRNLLLTLVILFFATAVRLEATSISQTIASINADAQKKDGPERVLKSISASTHVPVGTLEKEKAKFNLSFGDLYVAHAITSASGKQFDQIVGLKMKGQSWDKIADDNNVSLGGKKVKKDVANAKPTPAPKTSVPRPPDSKGYKSMP